MKRLFCIKQPLVVKQVVRVLVDARVNICCRWITNYSYYLAISSSAIITLQTSNFLWKFRGSKHLQFLCSFHRYYFLQLLPCLQFFHDICTLLTSHDIKTYLYNLIITIHLRNSEMHNYLCSYVHAYAIQINYYNSITGFEPSSLNLHA